MSTEPEPIAPASTAPATPASAGARPLPDATSPPDYNPADYRWVPVRRRPRYDGWTEEKQRRFIEVLADTGIVALAAKEVGMTRETAYRLRRSAHGAAFARAWDAARDHAGSLLEDVAFERAIEGVEHNVYDEYGEVVCTRRVYNDRLLTFLLRHLKPERYGRNAPTQPAPEAEPHIALQASLREMEPLLPAPAEELLDPETLEDELVLADVADGVLPHFLSETRAAKSDTQLKAEEIAAQEARGLAVSDRLVNKQVGQRIEISRQDMVDLTRALDPTSRNERSKKRFR